MELPIFCRNVDSFPFRRIVGILRIYICPIFREGHAKIFFWYAKISIFSIPAGDHGPHDERRRCG
jgi:hypothetical protein